ncbi:RloB family protein [Bifidobacterium vespertilionis]|uniref:RloB family protein n=1 Tax=Bifidobacterium vespertilionis TaxID=2562524 RepID=UPI001F0B6277|nr:RloB family protein [Bifidobacterium vespertilionis]
MSRKKNMIPAHGRNARRPARVRKPRYLVVCGGQVTEPQYFRHLKSKNDDIAIDVKVKVLSPLGLANYAVRCKKDDDAKSDSGSRYAAVFVVVDVDDFHDHKEAQTICSENDIHLIISNPCFEVWLIDHIQECPSSCATTKAAEQYASTHKVTTGSRDILILM